MISNNAKGRIDTLEVEIAKLEIENRNLKLQIEDLKNKLSIIEFYGGEGVLYE